MCTFTLAKLHVAQNRLCVTCKNYCMYYYILQLLLLQYSVHSTLLCVLYSANTLCIAKCLVAITCLAITWNMYLETLHKVGGNILTYYIS